MTYPKQKHPELPYFAARKLQELSQRMADLVMLGDGQGESFARGTQSLVKELAALRRAIRDRGLLGVEEDA